ncbi:MAG: N-6 DNA methylase, partial [Candidatus Caldatribacteriota bacterium]|nr:N-6 DNA methylase [Candidatus Caldatribacteriota bacterium]
QEGKYVIKCQIKNRYKIAKPEEIIRQLWIYRLLNEYNYPKKRIRVKKTINFGSRIEPQAVDIVVFQEDLKHYHILFEIKRPYRTAGLEQLKSYCNTESAPIGIWSNGDETIRLHREEPNLFVEIPRIPKISETLKDVLTERWSFKWLEEHNELKQGKNTLKKILLDLEELVLRDAGVKVFDEIFKLIYAKLYDEWNGINNPDYQLEFFAGDRSPEKVKRAIAILLEGAKRSWAGVFDSTDKIELMDTHLKICVSFLEKIKLFNSNLRIIDEAFKYLIPEESKKKEGQFFTPRPIQDMVTRMLNPKAYEFVIDPDCGSAGFLLHSVKWVAGGVVTGKGLPMAAKSFTENNIYGIDFTKEAIKIAKAINLIVGNGKSHIFGGGSYSDSLNPLLWNDEIKASLRPRLLRFPENPEKDRENQNRFLYFDFDLLMTNPLFSDKVKERDVLRLYQLAVKNSRLVKQIDRHILFLNRSLQFIRPGGRMAIVLPQVLLNSASAEYIRRFIIDEARILAVVGLHRNTFKPHAGIKTSILFLQKYTDEEKKKIREIKVKCKGEWFEFIGQLKKEYQDVSWDKLLSEEGLNEELKSFIETYFEEREEIEEETRNKLKEKIEGSDVEETEETEKIEEIKRKKSLKALTECVDLVEEAKKYYQNISWDKLLCEGELSEELKSFVNTYFEKKIKSGESIEGSDVEETEKIKSKKSLKALIEKLQEMQVLLKETQKKLKGNILDDKKIEETRKEIDALTGEIEKFNKEISQRTLGGQIYLTLNDEEITEQFKNFWIDGKAIKEIDYPIFFAVNQKSLKDNKGEYRYKRGPKGGLLLDEYGRSIIDHDLDEIAEAFVKFAKEQNFNFWGP